MINKNNLQIYLITYNRIKKLKNTLDHLLRSPVKDFDITILDNASTDGTSELIEQYRRDHSNIKHIRHLHNIGGNANICRAFEMGASCRKEYLWVLCDDDKLDFASWDACQKLLAIKPIAIVVANYGHPQKGPAYLFRQLSFVPAAIYRTDLLTSDTLMNMYFSISNLFPQLAVAAAALNTNSKLPILDKPLVTMQLNPGNDSYLRGTSSKSKIHPLMGEMFWSLGYLRSIQMLQDKSIQKECSNLAWAEDYTSFYYFCKIWRLITHKNSFANYFEAIHLLKGKAKWKFIFFVPLSFFISFYSNPKGLNVCLFGFAKIRIWKYRQH